MILAGTLLRRLKLDRELVRSYLSLVSGSVGRLGLSLAYFVSVANGLSVGDFGLFATASAVGVVLSRVAGFGFVSPLYRAATTRPRLIGVHAAGLLAAFVLSLPAVIAGAAIFYLLVFSGEMSLMAFAMVMVAEIVFWRAVEVIVIVNNGLGRFGRGAIAVVTGSGLRALAAVAFVTFGSGSLSEWANYYALANAAALAFAFVAFWPRHRLRLRPKVTFARWRDSISVAGAEIVFYLQSELDKMLVLAIGGPQTAGLYAIVMRLVDLTALPIRSATTIIVQKLMRTPRWLASWRIRIGIEGAIAAVSTAGIAVIGGILHVFPTLLGDNVATAAPLVLLAMLVPAFRNLIEYESELLYARGKTTIRVAILAMVGLMKASLLVALLDMVPTTTHWMLGLNAMFLATWMLSALATYIAFDWSPRIYGSVLRPAPQPGE